MDGSELIKKLKRPLKGNAMKPDDEFRLIMRMMVGDYNPDQPRDKNGRWIKSGSTEETILNEKETVFGGSDPICKIDKSIYQCISPDIDSDEVILSDDIVAHSENHHPDDFEEIRPYIPVLGLFPSNITSGSFSATGIYGRISSKSSG